MPNILDANGLQTATYAELLEYFTTQFKAIYGADVNLESSSPDGQWINIQIQAILDLQDFIKQVYNSFDPDNAIGVVLDQRVTINGIQRQAGSYTVTPITIVNSQSVNLYGLDQETEEVYTVADNAGNKWELLETQLGLAAGSHVLNFRAAEIGAQYTIPNTINVPVTIVLGVTSINNPTTYTTLGVNQESDANLRLRRQKSVSIVSQGYLAGLIAALEATDGVTYANVYENTTNTTDSDGIPGHSIWVIVAGTATPADIANAIYTKRNAGCGMKGDTSYSVLQVNGDYFDVYWDGVEPEPLFIMFTATSINGIDSVNLSGILEQLPTLLVPGVYEELNINALATLIQTVDPNCLVTDAGFSTGKTQYLGFSEAPDSGGFSLRYDGSSTPVIYWSDSTATIQGLIQALPGLSSVTVTGSIASQELEFDMSSVVGLDQLITVWSNSLTKTASPVSIFPTGFTPTILPTSKVNQSIVSAENIIAIPMQLTPPTSIAAPSSNVTFEGIGGYGVYTYSVLVNNSGSGIDASTGVYTAGLTPGVDTVQVADSFGNTATATVTVS